MKKLLISSLFLIVPFQVFAIDLGTMGATYEISEKDILQEIEARAKDVDWDKVISDAQQELEDNIGLATYMLPKADDNETFYIDITSTLDMPIYTRDRQGVPQVLYPEGYVYNALDYTKLTTKYVIFDATRKEEVNWYKENYSDNLSVMPIITNGSALTLAEKVGREVYLLDDEIKHKFQIKATPTLVYQEKNMLRADEFLVEELPITQSIEVSEVLSDMIIDLMDFVATDAVAGACESAIINPISDVRWSCTMPITLGGVSVDDVPMPEASSAILADKMSTSSISPVCTCFDPVPRAGLTFSMNVAFRIGESVKDAFCFPSLGMSLGSGSWGAGGGDSGSKTTSKTTFTYTHLMSFVPTQALSLFVDVLCLQVSETPMSILYMSEFMPQAKSSELSLLLAPETILFANPVAQAYCMVDSLLTVVELTDPIGYWCVGGHSVFPLSNHVTEVDYVDAASINIAKILFTQSRLGTLLNCYGANAICGCVPSPIWNKMEYRFQLAKPMSDIFCRRMGKPSIMWNTPNKNPTFHPMEDNLAFIIWRKRDCCVL